MLNALPSLYCFIVTDWWTAFMPSSPPTRNTAVRNNNSTAKTKKTVHAAMRSQAMAPSQEWQVLPRLLP